MKTALRLIAGFAAGAAVMYWLDPVAGRRRRALARDQGSAVGRKAKHFAEARSRRAANRMLGVLARARSRLSHPPIDDDTLQARIRARLGHIVEHPGAVEVKVNDGHVELTGSASTSEVDELVDSVAAMQGVEGINYRFSMHEAEDARPPSAQH